MKYRLSPNCPNASWKARSIRSPLGEARRGSGWKQPMPRDWQDASQAFLTSSVSGASWNTVTLESTSHYLPVNALLDRYILKPLNLYAQSGPHPHVTDSRPIPSSQLALTTQWKANQLGFLLSIFRSVPWLFSQPSVLKEPEAGMGKLREMVIHREAWRVAVHGITKSSKTEQLDDNEESESVSCSVVSDFPQSQGL